MSILSTNIKPSTHNDRTLITELSQKLEKTALPSSITDMQIGYLNEISQKTLPPSTTICLDSNQISSEIMTGVLQFRLENRALINEIQNYRVHYPLAYESAIGKQNKKIQSLLHFLTIPNPLARETADIDKSDPEIGIGNPSDHTAFLEQIFHQIIRSFPEERMQIFLSLTSKYNLNHRDSNAIKSALIEYSENEYQNWRANVYNPIVNIPYQRVYYNKNKQLWFLKDYSGKDHPMDLRLHEKFKMEKELLTFIESEIPSHYKRIDKVEKIRANLVNHLFKLITGCNAKDRIKIYTILISKCVLNKKERNKLDHMLAEEGKRLLIAREMEMIDYRRLQYNRSTKSWNIAVPLTNKQKLEVDQICKHILDARPSLRIQTYTALLSKNYHLTIQQHDLLKAQLFSHLEDDIVYLEEKIKKQFDYNHINYNEENRIYIEDEELKWSPNEKTWKRALEAYLQNQPNLHKKDPETGLRMNLLEHLYMFNLHNFRNEDGDRDTNRQAQAFIISFLTCRLGREECLLLQENLEAYQENTTIRYKHEIDQIKKTIKQISMVRYNHKDHIWYFPKETVHDLPLTPSIESSPELSRMRTPDGYASEDGQKRIASAASPSERSASSSSDDDGTSHSRDLIIPNYYSLPIDSPLRRTTDEFMRSYTGQSTSALGIELLKDSDMSIPEIVRKLHTTS